MMMFKIILARSYFNEGPLCTASRQLIKNALPLAPHPDVGRGLHHYEIVLFRNRNRHCFFTQPLHFTTSRTTLDFASVGGEKPAKQHTSKYCTQGLNLQIYVNTLDSFKKCG